MWLSCLPYAHFTVDLRVTVSLRDLDEPASVQDRLKRGVSGSFTLHVEHIGEGVLVIFRDLLQLLLLTHLNLQLNILSIFTALEETVRTREVKHHRDSSVFSLRFVVVNANPFWIIGDIGTLLRAQAADVPAANAVLHHSLFGLQFTEVATSSGN